MTPSPFRIRNPILSNQYDTLLLLISLAIPQVIGLEVIPGSNCTNSCLSTVTGYTTNASDINCHDSDYNKSVSGGAFQECVSCELQSETFNRQTGQTDLGWALCKPAHCSPRGIGNILIFRKLDNIRYTLSWCLYDYPESENQTVSNTCTATCAPIANALETNLLTPNASTTYDYCQDQDFSANVGACASCYQIISNQLYLSNCKLFTFPSIASA